MAMSKNCLKSMRGKLFKQLLTNPCVYSGNSTFSRSMSEYEVVIAGGGSGGISTGARLSKVLGKGKVAIIEPADVIKYFCIIF